MLSQLRKWKTGLLATVFVLLVAAVAAYVLWPNQRIQVRSNTDSIVRIDHDALAPYLAEFNIFTNNKLSHILPDDSSVTVDRIVITLVDTPQDMNPIVMSEPASSIGIEVQDTTLYMDWYINEAWLMSLPEEYRNPLVSGLLLHNLYFLEHKPVVLAEPRTQALLQTIDALSNDLISFARYEDKRFAQLLSFQLVPQAYAQSCSGTASVGTLRTTRACQGGIDNGSPCSSNLDCEGGSCVSSSNCEDTRTCSCNEIPLLCAEVSGSFCGQGSSCIASHNCSSGGGSGNQCPAGQIFCGGCVNGCRQNSQSCNAWIDQECSGAPGGNGGGGGGGCTPNCNQPLCGQGNGCGGVCSNHSNGSPPTPLILYPNNGSTIQLAAPPNYVRIVWSQPNKANRYYYEIYPAGSNCYHPSAECGDHLLYDFFLYDPQPGQWQVRVRARNTSCPGNHQYSDWTPWTYFTVAIDGTITGTVYSDPNAAAGLVGGLCNAASGVTPLQPGTSQLNVLQNGVWQDTSNVAANGTFSLTAPYSTSGNNSVNFYPQAGSGWICTCPVGCSYGSGINSPQSGVNFYLTQARGPWWQVQGGPILAMAETGTAIRSYIPPTCTTGAGCRPYLSKLASTDKIASAGYVVTGGGAIDLSENTGIQNTNVSENWHKPRPVMDRKVTRETYEYFYRLYDFPENPQSDFTTTAGAAAKPTNPPVNSGVNAYYHNGNMNITVPWTLSAGEKIVVFVDGNLNINNRIDVPVGAFVSFISTGNISVGWSLRYNAPFTQTAGLVEGVYIANGQFRVTSFPDGTSDGTFVGEGTFVGWGGVTLMRDFDNGGPNGVQNNTKPVELFKYRPDLVENVPDEWLRPTYTWREVAP